MRLATTRWTGHAFRVFGLSAGISCSVGGVLHEMAAVGKPVGPPALVPWIVAVFATSLSGLTATAIFVVFAARGRNVAGNNRSLGLTSRQARRLSCQFAQAGVHISPARLRAINAGAEATEAELVDIEFGLIATDPDHDALLHSGQTRPYGGPTT
jgi:hypothetical protein